MTSSIPGFGVRSILASATFISVLAIGGLVLPASAFAIAPTIYVDANSVSAGQDGTLANPYKTIQAAVAVASAGTTIDVAAGIYSGDVVISKANLTIHGTGSVVLNVGSGYGFDLDEPGNVATGFTMTGITVNASPSTTYLFKAFKADGLTLTNDSFNGGAGNTGGGVDLNTTSNVSISNVTATGFHKNGFAVTSAYTSADNATPSSNITFNNISSTNNGWDGIAFYTIGGNGGAASITGVTFTGANTVSGNGQGGIFLEGDTDAHAFGGVTPRFTVTTDGTSLDLTRVAFSQSGIFFDFDINNYQTAPVNAVGATFEGKTGAQMSSFERGVVDTLRIYDKLDNAALGLVTYYTEAAPAAPTNLTAKFQYDSTDVANGSGLKITAKPGNNNLELQWTAPSGTVTGYHILEKFPDGTTDLSYQGPNTNAWLAPYDGFGQHGEGEYDYQVVAVNSAGESAPSETFTLYYDKHIPTATLVTAPADGSTVSAPFTVDASATDNVKLKGLFVDIRSQDGSTWVAGCTGTPVYSTDGKTATLDCSVNTSHLVDGTTYMLRAHASDFSGYGNVNPEGTRYFIFSTTPADTTGPVVTVTPVAGSTLNGTETFTITVTDDQALDPSKLTHVWVYLYDNAGTQKHYGANVDLSSGTGTFTVNTTLLDDGAATLDVGKLYDAAGNPSGTGDSYFKNYQISNTIVAPAGPSVPTNGAPNGTTLNTNEFDFTWDASTGTGPITYEFQSSQDSTATGGVLTNGLWQSGTLTTNSIHSSGAGDGTWYWQVRAQDADGNYSDWSPIWTVTLDTTHTAPTPSVTTNDADTITTSDATLKGTNGPIAADGESFWISTTPGIDVSSTNVPSGVVSTQVLPAVDANGSFSAQLSSATSDGIPSNLPAITANTTYYYVAWAQVDGQWIHGAEKSVTTASDEVSTADVTTNDATYVTATDATLNGTIGSNDASGHSFWVSTSTIVTSSANIPEGVYSTHDMGPITASSTFSATLSSMTAPDGAETTGNVSGSMPALVAGTTYHYVAWANIDGTWVPGEEKTVTLGTDGGSGGPGHGAAPTASQQSVTLNQDDSTDITLSGTDPEGDSLTFSIASSSANGTLSAVTGNTVTYTPNAGFHGSDSFTFVANDGSSNSAPATVSITVNQVSTPVTPTTVTVRPSAPQGWASYGLAAGGTADFATISGAPSGGALELTTSDDVHSVTHFKKSVDAALSDISTISYATKQIAAADQTNGNATLRLSIDLNGDGTEDDQLMYEPYYNGFSGSTDWNTWTITHSNGKLWSNYDLTYNGLGAVSAGSYASNFTLNDVLHDHPDAKLIGLIVSMGSNNVSQDVAVDDVRLATSTEDTTYDFEPDAAVTSSFITTSSINGNRRNGSGGGFFTTLNTGSTSGNNGGQVRGAAAFNFTRDLHIGMTGDDVTELQTELITAGYLHIPAATGYFGPLTRAAVAAWQAAHNITPAVGYFGPISRAKYAADGGFGTAGS